MAADYLQVSTVAGDRDTAANLARSAVAAKLAAGAQVHGPVTSFFWHLGESGEGEEWQVTLKTRADRYAELEALLLREHTWDNPEVSATPLVNGTAAYFDWIDRTVGGQAQS
jgi:periplasmic divalent cation tolerance protein